MWLKFVIIVYFFRDFDLDLWGDLGVWILKWIIYVFDVGFFSCEISVFFFGYKLKEFWCNYLDMIIFIGLGVEF